MGIDLENLFENKPHGRAKLKMEEWKKKINYLVNLYNSNAGYKVYNKIKWKINVKYVEIIVKEKDVLDIN